MATAGAPRGAPAAATDGGSWYGGSWSGYGHSRRRHPWRRAARLGHREARVAAEARAQVEDEIVAPPTLLLEPEQRPRVRAGTTRVRDGVPVVVAHDDDHLRIEPEEVEAHRPAPSREARARTVAELDRHRDDAARRAAERH